MATATTIIVPIANDMNVLSPESSMPAIAMITVKPEISTARPDVAAAASSRGPLASPGSPLVTLAAEVEERVVDTDREPDQQDHLVDGSVHRHELAGQRDEPERREHGRQPDQDRNDRRYGRAEHEQQDHERQDERDQARPSRSRR